MKAMICAVPAAGIAEGLQPGGHVGKLDTVRDVTREAHLQLSQVTEDSDIECGHA